ncbi:MAG: PIG-L deacetylase family protein [Candidatus Hydrogenedens sp.]
MKTVLVVVAHGDDMEFMCAGTAYRWIKEYGFPVYELILTDNRKGTYTLRESEIVTLSKQEAIEAGKILGLKEVRFGNFIDGELEDMPRKHIRNIIIDMIREVKANIVLSWDPFAKGEDHPDHRVTAMATYEAITFSSNPNFGTPGLYPPHSVSEAYWFAKKPEDALTFVDITNSIDKKVESLLAHETQMELTFDSLLLEAKTLGVDLPGMRNVDKDTRNQIIANAVKSYTAEKGKVPGYSYAEQFRYEKFGMLEMVLSQELVKPEFPPLNT